MQSLKPIPLVEDLSTIRFIIVSDIHEQFQYRLLVSLAIYIVSLRLVPLLSQWVQNHRAYPDFIICLGDVVTLPHPEKATVDQITEAESRVSTALFGLETIGQRVVFIPGNHDPPATVLPNPPSYSAGTVISHMTAVRLLPDLVLACIGGSIPGYRNKEPCWDSFPWDSEHAFRQALLASPFYSLFAPRRADMLQQHRGTIRMHLARMALANTPQGGPSTTSPAPTPARTSMWELDETDSAAQPTATSTATSTSTAAAAAAAPAPVPSLATVPSVMAQPFDEEGGHSHWGGQPLGAGLASLQAEIQSGGESAPAYVKQAVHTGDTVILATHMGPAGSPERGVACARARPPEPRAGAEPQGGPAVLNPGPFKSAHGPCVV
ncbi:hypothetical protein PAPYR_3556 [Paratrimastix pyriformis]|uniref:Calcineurin-like phosphoesterase domain-containing protein n=1 Tax=Paratrimastix pyriformis TaxID=342808 RepID=A0ABQ8ULV9_9EUKA|nr:hypothetical protein PAPYR_3556 [Paratrimastix pyriformis]